jgi:hypothetical protein
MHHEHAVHADLFRFQDPQEPLDPPVGDSHLLGSAAFKQIFAQSAVTPFLCFRPAGKRPLPILLYLILWENERDFKILS